MVKKSPECRQKSGKAARMISGVLAGGRRKSACRLERATARHLPANVLSVGSASGLALHSAVRVNALRPTHEFRFCNVR